MTGVLTTVFGVDLVTVAAFLLLALGVVGAAIPVLPGAALSLAGVLVYWWGTGFTDPGTILLVVLVLTALLGMLADWLGGAVAARVGGASTSTAAIAGVVALLLLFVAGPIGVLLGAAGTVFVVEYFKHRDAKAGAVAAGAYVLGFFASAIVQVLLALSILVAMVAVVFF